MVPKISKKYYLDPIDALEETLEHTWHTLCDFYTSGGELPDIQTLFNGADVTRPRQAAETVIANMLFDLAEGIGRFSPWYTKPTRAFGISTIRDYKAKSIRCILAPEGVQKWEALIEPLSEALIQNSGVIQAVLFVESLVGSEPVEKDECVIAKCGCFPPHTIRLKKSALDTMEIYCKACMQPFGN